MQHGRFNVLLGGQAGSESKGKLSAYLMRRFDVPVIAGSFSPNAGHTAYRDDGKPVVTYHIPAGIVGNPKARIFLGAPSVLNPALLLQEIETLGLTPNRLFIDPRAILIEPRHIEEEERTLLTIGSTAQGVGAARRDKLMRDPDLRRVGQHPRLAPFTLPGTSSMSGNLIGQMASGNTVLYEMTQGFDLCLEHGIDPRYCTSRVINPAMALAEAGLPPYWLGHVYGVLRPYPIRVNNRSGSSGPYAEAGELSWEEITRRSRIGEITGNADPLAIFEKTTTTKLPRRVFEFCWSRFLSFIDICAPDFLCLQFANYLDWSVYGVEDARQLTDPVRKMINALERASYSNRCKVAYVGTSPQAMVDLGEDHLEWPPRPQAGRGADYNE